MIRVITFLWFFILHVYGAPEDLLLSKSNLSLLDPVQMVLQNSSVAFYEDKEFIGYGTLLSTEGDIFTKASIFKGREKVTLRLGKKEYTPRFINESREWDVALYKVQIEQGIPVDFSDDFPEVGDVLVSNGVTSLLKRRLKFGVISALAREIPAKVAALDFFASYDEKEKGFVIEGMIEGGAAEQAGIKKGDLLISVDEQELNAPDLFLLDLYDGKWADDMARVIVYRGGKEKVISVPYLWRHDVYKNPQDRNEAMSGRISGRRTGFPKVIQHDIALTKRTVGGPLLNLEGKCIGMNIARFSRAETYAIPAPEMQSLYKQLQGKQKED